MSTPQSAPTAPPGAARNVSPNQYHLRGYSIQISYYPDGEGPLTTEGPVVVSVVANQNPETEGEHDGGQVRDLEGSRRQTPVPPQSPEWGNHCRQPRVRDKGQRGEGYRGDQDPRTQRQSRRPQRNLELASNR